MKSQLIQIRCRRERSETIPGFAPQDLALWARRRNSTNARARY